MRQQRTDGEREPGLQRVSAAAIHGAGPVRDQRSGSRRGSGFSGSMVSRSQSAGTNG
jgi:hypothetical protein